MRPQAGWSRGVVRHGEAGEIPRVTDENVAEILEADRAALVLAKSGCGHCAAYERELVGRRRPRDLEDLVVGKLVLDAPGSGRFKRDNPWLQGVETLPYTVLYRQGRPVDGFAASRASYAWERARSVFGPRPNRG